MGKRHHGEHELSGRVRRQLDELSGHGDSCPSGKQRYASRKLAKRVAGRLRHRGRMGAYRCATCGWFHLGHLRGDVKAGEASRGEAYGPRPPAA